jgi:hypothetical protein
MDSGTFRHQSFKERCMKSILLNLIAAAALLFSGMALASDEEQPMAEPIESPSSPAVQEPQPPQDSASTSRDIPTRTNRSQSLDLRYCLELGTNAEIAKCAGE